MRIPQNREATLRLIVDDENGELLDATGTPTVTVTNGSGTVIVAAAASTRLGLGQYSYVLSPQSAIDDLTAEWTFVVGGFTRKVSEQVRVTGFRLVPLWRFREDAELTSLNGAFMRRISDAVENVFSDALGFPPVVESKRVTWIQEDYTPELVVPGVTHPVSVVELTRGTSEIDASGISARDGAYVQNDGSSFGPGTYSAWVTHGLEHPSERLVEVGIILGRYISRQNNYPERALRIVSNDTEITFAMTGDADHPTGLPEVDTVLTKVRDQFVI